MRDNERRSAIILSVIGIVPVVWLALLISPSVEGGLPEILPSLMNVFNNPFHIEVCEDSVKTVLILLLCYGMGIGIYFSTQRNYRRREEHGSAKWGNARAVDKKYRQSPYSDNKLMTQNVRIGLNAKKHRRNLNTLVCGGSGAGKTRFYCKPNLMQCNTSFVILDPKGEILRDMGKLLEKKGYEVRVLDLISMEKSHCYNPFVYLQNDNDVQKLVTNLFKSTTPKGSQSQDPFWDTSASMLLLALVFYLHYEAPEEEQNFAMVMEMLRAGSIEDEEDTRPSPLDELFAELEMNNPDHIALKYYRSYHSGSAKTLKSIQITLAARLEKFNLESLASLTSADELDLPSMGEKKVALFALIPDNDSSFNFLVSILYTQLFQQLESAAGLFLVCVAAPRLSIWIFTFQKFRLEVLAVKYAPRKVYIKESGGYVELSYTDFCRRRQADKGYMDKLFIPVQGCLLEVVREQYADFYRDRERWRYLQKLDARNSLLSLDGFTDSEGNPLDFIADEAADIAETVVNAVMVDRLKAALPLLSDSEQELIQAIFFDGLSEREVGARLGITQSVVNKRKARILIKLRKIIEN